MKVLFYRDSSGDWRWRAKATNGRIVADSAEGYSSASKAMKGWRSLARGVERGPVVSGMPGKGGA